MKTADDYFRDWEGEVFGYGYGSGEEHVIGALKAFMALLEDDRTYNYQELEVSMGGPAAWLLINALCRADIIEYGTSPRFGWLTNYGEALRDYLGGKSVDDLTSLLCEDDDDTRCYRSHCNCEKPFCTNPFWRPCVPRGRNQ